MKLYKNKKSIIHRHGLSAAVDIAESQKIIQYKGKINLPGETFKWLTLWEINRFIKQGSLVGPHLRSILSLI